MSWLIAIGAALVCAIAGAAFSLAVSDLIVRAYHIPSFEGASGYFVLLVLLPIGALTGGITGLIALRAGPAGSTGLKFLLAPLATVGLLTIGYGLAYLAVERPPRIDGHRLSLELEVRLPPGAAIPEDIRDAELRISLYASDKDNRYVTIDHDKAGPRDDGYVIPCVTPINTARRGRTLLVGRGEESSQVIPLDLPAKPTRADTTWSPWKPAARRGGSGSASPNDAYEARYRVRVEE